MASTSTTLSLSSSSTLIDVKTPRNSAAVTSPRCVNLPNLPPLPVSSQNRDTRKSTTAYCRKIARNVIAKATGDVTTEVETSELPEIAKTIQEAWDKLDDKYAVTSLAFAGLLAVWGSSGMISAIDKLPLVPGILELVGIGYSGWFIYRNLVFKPEREALIQKVKNTYKDILGSS